MRYGSLLAGFVIVFASISANGAGADDEAADLCRCKSESAPEALEGEQGSSSNDSYWFTHASDVERDGGKHRFVFVLRNNHRENYLPAAWLRGDREVQLLFNRIAPGRCGRNTFETYQGFREDVDAVVQYGPQTQHEKQAPMYVRTDKSQHLAEESPVLRSRIIAGVDAPGAGVQTIDLQFGTRVESRDGASASAFRYWVVSKNRQALSFKIPSLDAAWDPFIDSKLDLKDRWQKRDDAYLVTSDAMLPQPHIIYLDRPHKFQERVMRVEILMESEPVASGLVNLFVPLP